MDNAGGFGPVARVMAAKGSSPSAAAYCSGGDLRDEPHPPASGLRGPARRGASQGFRTSTPRACADSGMEAISTGDHPNPPGPLSLTSGKSSVHRRRPRRRVRFG